MRLLAGGTLIEAGCLWIWTQAAALTAIYSPDFTTEFFARLPALRPFVFQPESDLDVDTMVARLEIGFVLMSAGYLLGLLVLTSSSRGTWLVVAFALLFRLTLALLPGVFSTDVFSYVMYGRIAAVDAANPYVQPPASFPDDPFLAWVFPFWRDQPSVYGPVWTDLSVVLSSVSATWSPFDQVALYRLTIIAFELLTLVALWWLLGRLRTPARLAAFAAFAWNPLVVFDLVGSTHNDAAMLLLLVLGIAAATARSRPGWLSGIALMVLGALIKYASGFAAVIWAGAWAAHARSLRASALRFVAATACALAISAAVSWPWFTSGQAFAVLGEAAGGRLVLNSAPDLLALTVADQLLVPNGMDSDTAHATARFWTRALSRALFGVYFAAELWRLWSCRHADDLADRALKATARVLLVFPLLVLTWVWSWYFAWSLVVAVLLGVRSLLCRLIIAYTLTALPVVYAHLYLNERLPGAFVLTMALFPLLVIPVHSFLEEDNRQ